MKKKIKISYLKKNDIKNLQKFIALNHKKNHILAKSKKVLNWFYFEKKKYNFLAAIIKNKIIGVQGYISLSKFDQKLKDIIFLAYWRVRKSQNIAIGLKIFKTIAKNKKFMGVVGIRDELMNYHKWQGFKIGKLNHFFFTNNKFDKNKNIFKKKYKHNFLKLNYKILEIKKSNIKKEINNKIYKSQYPIKSNNFLINRYFKNPFYNYKIFLIKNYDIQLLFIFRIIKVKNYKIIKLVDLIGKEASIKFCGNFIDVILKKFNCAYLDFYNFGINKKILKTAGFVSRYDTQEIIPDHFEPFENRNIDINFAYQSKTKLKNIRICKSDGDMDRPSLI